jgi:hypothetical protein
MTPPVAQADLMTRASPPGAGEAPAGFYKKPWFWGTVAAVVVAGVAAALFISPGASPPMGDLDTIDARVK